MKLPVERWYEAIKERKSRRNYLEKPIARETLKELQECREEINQIFSEARIVIVEGNTEQIFKGFIGSYGSIKGAPAYAAFIGDTRDENINEKIGYCGECFILEATALGLGTCWVAGTYRPDRVEEELDLKEYEQLYSITPLGYVRNQYSLGEKITTRMVSSRQRKELDELCQDGYKQDWPQWIQSALQAARLAPSAINRQPWRFRVENDSIIVYKEGKSRGKVALELDCGIAMLHIEVGALKEGKKGAWEFLKGPDVACFK